MATLQTTGTAFPKLASIATDFQLNNEARIGAIEAIMDTITAAAAAPEFPFTDAILCNFGRGEAPLWFTEKKSSTIGAAFANSFTSAALDLDDGHRDSRGHPGACVVPAVFAELATLEAAGKSISIDQVLKAVAVGYEVSLRVAGAKSFYARTGFWAGIAAAAGVASLNNLPADRYAHALAIAGETGPHMATTTAGPEWPQPNGTHVKEGIPWGVASGVAAVHFAKSGMSGPLDLVDHEPFFDLDYILAPRDRPLICETYTKFQATCRHVNGPVEAVDALMKKNNISPTEITSVRVEAYSGALRISNHNKPSTIVEAQYSIPYCVGLAAVKGLDVFLPMDGRDIGNVEAESIAERVTVENCEEFEREFPARTLCRVTVQTQTATFVSPTMAPSGDADKRPDWEQRRQKFVTATRRTLSESSQEKLLLAFEDIRSSHLSTLTTQLFAVR